ncbi:hypothetical protein M758_11G116800 [Ceratodon purpureus]|nr:hypothetical protein M758_11G116800 [Ceratodon purpureus]
MVRPKSDSSFVDDWRSMMEPDLDAIAYNGATCDPTRVDLKVLDWVRESCGENPHFVKVINRNAANGRPGLLSGSSTSLAVPGPFVRENFRNLQRVVTLDNGHGRKWKVVV